MDKHSVETISETLFSLFEKTNRVGEIPEFLEFLQKHASHLKPSVEVSVSGEILGDESIKHGISKQIKESLGIHEVSFVKREDGDTREISILGSIPPFSSARQSMLESTAYKFFSFLVEKGLLNEIDSVVKKMTALYDKYVDEVEVTVTSDVPYSHELEKKISDFCVSYVGAKRAVVTQVLDKNQTGGFKVKWRDLVYDATYGEALKNF